MKKTLLLFAFMATANIVYADWFGEIITKQKRVTKQYAIKSTDILSIDNQFGDVIIKTWDKNEFSVDVEIEVKRRSESKAQSLLDDIEISENQKAGGVYFKTHINRSNINNVNGESMRIDYTVYMPRTNPIDIENKFGNVNMGDYVGDIDMKVEYGNLIMGDITGSEKKIKVQFGKVDIKSIAVAGMNIEYSPVVIGSAQRLGLKSQFGKTTISSVQTLNVIQEYGNLEIGTVGTITGKLEFADLKFEKVNKSVDMKINYAGKANFGIIDQAASLIKVKSSFSNLNFEFEKGQNLNAGIKVIFGSFKNNNDDMKREIHRTDDDDDAGSWKVYNGKVGNGRGSLFVSAEYGNVYFK